MQNWKMWYNKTLHPNFSPRCTPINKLILKLTLQQGIWVSIIYHSIEQIPFCSETLSLSLSFSLSPSSSPYLSFFDFLSRYHCTGILYGINVRCKLGAGVYFIHFKALDSRPCNGTSNAVYSVLFHLSLCIFMWKGAYIFYSLFWYE